MARKNLSPFEKFIILFVDMIIKLTDRRGGETVIIKLVPKDLTRAAKAKIHNEVMEELAGGKNVVSIPSKEFGNLSMEANDAIAETLELEAEITIARK